MVTLGHAHLGVVFINPTQGGSVVYYYYFFTLGIYSRGRFIIIIIIINDIYIAQIRKIQQMCYQQLNRKVYNCFLNTSREMSGDRSKLFQTTGPCTAKLRLP